MAPQYFLYWIYLNQGLIYHLWNSDKQLMNQPVCYQQTVMSSLSSWFGGTPNRFQLDRTEWIKCCPKALLKCYFRGCLPSLIQGWILGRAFVLFIVCMLFPETEISETGKKKKILFCLKPSFYGGYLYPTKQLCYPAHTDATAWGRTTAICIKDCNAALRCSWWPMMFQ